MLLILDNHYPSTTNPKNFTLLQLLYNKITTIHIVNPQLIHHHTQHNHNQNLYIHKIKLPFADIIRMSQQKVEPIEEIRERERRTRISHKVC